jgi:uncharacterized protein YndB with AHSA1/START domain
MEPLEIEFTVACSPDHAFAVWTDRISQWWPKGHSVSKDPELDVVIEPRPGGRIYERTSAGDEHDWGEVTAWEPPRVLRYLWHLAQDRDDATEVEVRFNPDADQTRVTILHEGWERLGEKGADLRGRNRKGWAGVIPSYEEVVNASSGRR